MPDLNQPPERPEQREFAAGMAQLREAMFVGVKEACPDIVKTFDEAIQSVQMEHTLPQDFWRVMGMVPPCTQATMGASGAFSSAGVMHPDIMLVVRLATTAQSLNMHDIADNIVAITMKVDTMIGAREAQPDDPEPVLDRPANEHLLLVLNTARDRLADNAVRPPAN